MNYFYNPVRTYFGKDSISYLNKLIKQHEGEAGNILLITRGRDFKGSEEHIRLLSQLKGMEVYELEFIESNPDITDAFDIFKIVKEYDYDMVIGVGGGSVLDMSKAMAAFRGLEFDKTDDVRETIVNKRYLSNSQICPWIGIPTTSGTGSEVTPWATVWDKEKGLKYSIASNDLFAFGAVIDPCLTLKLPVKITASTSLDALCHAVEAYWSKNTNTESRMYALTAISNIVGNLEKLIEKPGDIDLREKIAMASFCAGKAFSNTKTTACHSISYPMTMMFKIGHGIAASLTLGRILKCNEDALVEKEMLYNAFGITRSLELETFVHTILQKAGIPYRLKDYGVKENDLNRIVQNAYTKGRMDNNPVMIEKNTLYNILKSII